MLNHSSQNMIDGKARPRRQEINGTRLWKQMSVLSATGALGQNHKKNKKQPEVKLKMSVDKSNWVEMNDMDFDLLFMMHSFVGQ